MVITGLVEWIIMNRICVVLGNSNIHILTEKENLITLLRTATTRMGMSFAGFDFEHLLSCSAN